jgi:hypothetical protein
MGMKDLLKTGRPLNEYLTEDGTLKRYCLTCIHRHSIKESMLGGWLCSGGTKMYNKCCPSHHGKEYQNAFKKEPDYILWEPRVDTNAFLAEEEFEI